MWGLFSSGSKTPKKETVDKEEYDQMLDESRNYSDKIRFLNSEYKENKGKLEVAQKKIEGLEKLVTAKCELIRLFEPSKESLIHSDLKAAEELRQALASRIAQLKEENEANKEELKRAYESVCGEMGEDEYEESKKVVKSMSKILMVNAVGTMGAVSVANAPEEKKGTEALSIKEKFKGIDNSKDVVISLKKIPNKLEEYERSNVYSCCKLIGETWRHTGKHKSADWMGARTCD
eukprot:TRINITY_DN59_c0_g1_i2.p1 TRINITY_DN59_c0_g1~~TRINITY_DN59_c0_g1_i2.p1  ORF type:complete len:234 (+),score=70.18 TRINITY_DN59_c0_g1_i2:51-752(+)